MLMKSKRRLLILADLLLIVGLVVFGNPYPRQLLFGPTIQGVPLCAWQEDLRRQYAPSVTDRYWSRVIKWFGVKTAPIDWQNVSNSERVTIAISLADDPSPKVRQAVCRGLYMATSKEAFAALIRLLDDEKEKVREQAAISLRSVNPSNIDGAADRIKPFLKHSDPHRRILAIGCLGWSPLHKDSLAAYVATLKGMFHDSDAKVRAAAIERFGLGTLKNRRTVKAIVPMLREHLLDTDPICRIEAACALCNLRSASPDVLAVLRAGLADGNPRHRLAVVRRLLFMGNVCAKVFDELVICAKMGDVWEAKNSAIKALGNCGKRAVPFLTAHMRDPKSEAPNTALEALGVIGAEASDAVPFLLTKLANDDERLSEWSLVEVLGEIGPSAKAAMPALLAMLAEKKQTSFRQHVIVALGKTCGGAEDVIDRLIAFLNEGAEGEMVLHYAAAEGLAHAGPGAKKAVPSLIRWPKSSESGIHHYAAALGSIGAEAKEAVPELIIRLGDGNALVIKALGQIAHDAPKVVPALLPFLNAKYEPHWRFRTIVVQSLAHFGPDAAAAIPALTTLLDDDDEELAEAAAAALAAIDPARYPKWNGTLEK